MQTVEVRSPVPPLRGGLPHAPFRLPAVGNAGIGAPAPGGIRRVVCARVGRNMHWCEAHDTSVHDVTTSMRALGER